MNPANSFHVLLCSKQTQLRCFVVTIAIAAVFAILSEPFEGYLFLMVCSLLFAVGTGLIFRKFTTRKIEVSFSSDDLSLKFGKNSEEKFSLNTIRTFSESYDLFGDKVLRIEFRDRKLTFVRPAGSVLLVDYKALIDTLQSLPGQQSETASEIHDACEEKMEELVLR